MKLSLSYLLIDSQGAAANVPTAIGILGVTFPPGKAKNYAFSAYGKLLYPDLTADTYN